MTDISKIEAELNKKIDTEWVDVIADLFQRVRELEDYVNAPRLLQNERVELLEMVKGLSEITGKRYTHVSYHDRPVNHIRFYYFDEYDSITISRLPKKKRLVIGKKYFFNELLGENHDIC